VGVRKVGSVTTSVNQGFADVSNLDEQGVIGLLVDTSNGVGEEASKSLISRKQES